MPYAPTVNDNSGQILAQGISQGFQNIGDYMKQRKEEQKQIKQKSSAYESLYKFAETSGNKELLTILDPNGVGLEGISPKDRAIGFDSGIEAFKVGSQVKQLEYEASRARTAALELGIAQQKLNNQQNGLSFSSILGRDATADEVTGANNAIAQLMGRGLTREQAIAQMGGSLDMLNQGQQTMADGSVQTANIPQDIQDKFGFGNQPANPHTPEQGLAVEQFLQSNTVSGIEKTPGESVGEFLGNTARGIGYLNPLVAIPNIWSRATGNQGVLNTGGERKRAEAILSKMNNKQKVAYFEQMVLQGNIKMPEKSAAATKQVPPNKSNSSVPNYTRDQ